MKYKNSYKENVRRKVRTKNKVAKIEHEEINFIRRCQTGHPLKYPAARETDILSTIKNSKIYIYIHTRICKYVCIYV